MNDCTTSVDYMEIAAWAAVEYYKRIHGYGQHFEIEFPLEMINPTKMKD